MATNIRTTAINECKLQQIPIHELISWYEAALFSNRSTALSVRLSTPLNLVLRCRHATVSGIAYLRKRLQEGKALPMDVSLQSHVLRLPDAHGLPGTGGTGIHASDLQSNNMVIFLLVT